MKFLLGLVLLVSAAAQSAPAPNLVLTCSDENAVGQEQNACDGIWAYQVPTNALIVSQGSLGIWRTFGDLIGADTVLVCTVPVEPGQYSSCRDASGARRTAFVRKDSIVARGSVTVDQTGGDYTDPVTAARNAFAGDTWCVAPQWPAQPCVIAIGDGVFILHETLRIPEGLVVAGAGKGATMLVADNGVEAAVSPTGNVRLSDLTIINRQPGLERAIGLRDGTSYLVGSGYTQQLNGVAIMVTGAAKNIGVVRDEVTYDIADSEITAEGAGSIGIQAQHQDYRGNTTLQRSRISAQTAVYEDNVLPGADLRLIDSHISGDVWFRPEWSLLEILRSDVQGDVNASNDWSRVVVTDASIRGDVTHTSPSTSITYINTLIDGNLTAGYTAVTLQGLSLDGELTLVQAHSARITRSHIVNFKTLAPTISLRLSGVRLEQTFVRGTLAVAAGEGSGVQAVSSVLAGPISASGTAVLSCTDTYGADYELLTASCQPQPP